MISEQLDLFAYRPTARVLPFPLDHEIFFVRETARQIERREPREADKFWRMTCNRLVGRLQIEGRTPEEITGKLERFAAAVYDEIERADFARRAAA